MKESSDNKNNKKAEQANDLQKQGIPFASLFDEIDKITEPSIHKPAKEETNKQEEPIEILTKGLDYAEALYRKFLALAEDIFNRELKLDMSHLNEVRELIKKAIPLVESGEQDFIQCVFNIHYRNTVDYHLLNTVNVVVLSLELAVELGYTSHSLERLGVAAFFHDIGMKSFADLVNLPRKLDDEEIALLQTHPLEGAAMLRELEEDFALSVADIVEQEHERIDGSGYPRSLNHMEISEYAQIIGLIDVYEALTHQRPHRKSQTSLAALKQLIKSSALYDTRLLKSFIERIGLYPRGTFVELNTKEVALVIAQNLRMPSCPVVKVIYDNKGDKSEQKRKIDLSKGTRIYIIRGM